MTRTTTTLPKYTLVTGGAGFLGSHVCERLVREGHSVVCVDSLLTGRVTNISHLLDKTSFVFVEGDLRDDIPDLPYEELWNLACPASPAKYQKDPIDTLLVNVMGMKAVLDKATEHNGRVFQASTSEVYGDPEIHPQPESYKGAVSTTGPRACYDEGKRAAEALCFDYSRMFGVDIRVARIFNSYGPRMDPQDGRVVSNFIVNALEDKPLELYGGGQQTRSLCFCSDLVEGMFRLMRHPTATGPVNLGSSDEYSIRELASLILEIVGSRSTVIDAALPIDDPMQRRPNIQLAAKLLHWHPSIELRDGLKLTIDYFKRQRKHIELGSLS